MSNGQLKAIVERIENIEADIKERQNDRTEIYAEAKSSGFDVAVLKTIIKERKQDREKLAEREAIADIYRIALGMISDLPLGRAAIERATA